MPILAPTAMENSFRAAAVAGMPRGTLAKMIAVRTVVATTNPAPTKAHGTMNHR